MRNRFFFHADSFKFSKAYILSSFSFNYVFLDISFYNFFFFSLQTARRFSSSTGKFFFLQKILKHFFYFFFKGVAELVDALD